MNRYRQFLLDQIPLQFHPPDLPIWVSLQRGGRWGGGGVIILSVYVEWERLFEGAIIRGTAIILENAVTSNKKKILFTVWKQYGLKITLFGFNTKKKKRNFNCRYETNHKFDKRREKVIKENKESLQKC